MPAAGAQIPPVSPWYLEFLDSLTVCAAGGSGRRYAVDGLVRSTSTGEVTTVVRRPYDFAAHFGWSEELASKHRQVVLPSFDEIRENPSPWVGADIAVCALGTTRQAAGGAAGFIKVDRDYVIAAAEMVCRRILCNYCALIYLVTHFFFDACCVRICQARASKVPRFSLLTAQGSGGAPSWLPRGVVESIHPLL